MPRSGRAWGVAVAVVFAAPGCLLVARALADVWRAPAILPQRWGTRGLDVALSGRALDALATSTAVAVTTTALALLLAWPAARVLGERRLRRPGLVLAVLALPLLVPPYATGQGLTEWFVRLGLVDTAAGLVLAHLVVVLPYVVAALTPGFGPRLHALEEMAATAGLPPRLVWRTVTLPAVAPALGAAAFLGFLVSWSQYGSSLAVGGGRPLLPLLLVPFAGSDPQVAAALGLLFVLPAVLVLALATRAARSPL
ncbi:ABC transporter permease [Paraconexibacter sp. AEG42_29]|uniref:ABC transporter permease n=1 Tax=Paraconexibacter sp. AEG42_29 TaxID=2997339 RepID=UPI00339D5F03